MLTGRTLGLAYLEESMLVEARAEFEKLVQLVPDEALGHANLGLVYMRQTDYPAAEMHLQKAMQIAPHDPDIRLNLADVYELTERDAAALALLEGSIAAHPGHVRSLYKLSQAYARSDDIDIRRRGETYLTTVVEKSPANIVATLQLTELSLRNDNFGRAELLLEGIQRQFPELPAQSVPFYQQALALIRDGNGSQALTPTIIFHNIMKVIPLYQKSMQDLKGTGGPLLGSPIERFSRDVSVQMAAQGLVAESLRFTDVTERLGIASGFSNSGRPVLAVGDYDNDGDADLYCSVWDSVAAQNSVFLYNNRDARFVAATAAAGLQHAGKDLSAIFADFDNDGWLDLLINNTTATLLYQNVQGERFVDVTRRAGFAQPDPCRKALFADFDHEGDLDLYLCGAGGNRLYRNNADSTFTDLTDRMQLAGSDKVSCDAAFGDFDDDGDLDLFVSNEGGDNQLYANLRQGQFQDITTIAGLSGDGGSKVVAVGDYDNDGTLDIFTSGLQYGQHALYRNSGEARFTRHVFNDTVQQVLGTIKTDDAVFLDFDNDGALDLLLSGEAGDAHTEQCVLLRNQANGQFVDFSYVLPDNLPAARITISDYDRDGDQDVFLAARDGAVKLLRNDGGNANGYLRVTFAGMRLGSSKNNYFGIGARLEVRAADLYQIRVIETPVTHLGLGSRTRAEAVRIVWPNGVPQNEFYLDRNQTLLEKQTLKGSCAFLYTWNGQDFEFVTDVMWRSALGMPLGIMGGETAYAFSSSSDDYFRVPGEKLQVKDGKYTLQITEELWETAYLDQFKLLVVDHPDSVNIYIDERFMPPPVPPLKIYAVAQERRPRTARDARQRDLLAELRDKDDLYVADFAPARYQGITEMHDLILDLGEFPAADPCILFLHGWIFPTDASINVALSQKGGAGVMPPYLQVIDGNGEWRTVIEQLGFPTGKNKTVVADLTGKFLSTDHRIRIRTNMEIYWDHVFFTNETTQLPVDPFVLSPQSADLHYRGFSRLYRKGGLDGPHWFDYNDVTRDPKWLDLLGDYTRYGEVVPLLLNSDDQYVIMNSGDEITVVFDAGQCPDLLPGWRRDFLVYTDGWIKDGDLNTAFGKTVAPLPFHAMRSYPYGADESYPEDNAQLQEYRRKYNTRAVTTEALRSALRRGRPVTPD
jgi:Tfp pilus assembly protein PilF